MRLKQLLGEEWYNILKGEFSKEYMIRLSEYVNTCRANTTVYPTEDDVFNAYRLTPYSKVRVCIIGQDPYINEGEAHGLSFSVKSGKYTPSLRQIEKIIRQEIYPDKPDYVWSNELSRWSEQGIMLLNAVMTVNAKKSNSHQGKGWELFTSKTVQELDNKGDVIFLLWGKDAQVFNKIIKKSIVIMAEHPQAANYQGRDWNNNTCFKKVNELLETEIKW